MANRALRVGDVVVVRPNAVARLRAEWLCDVKAHEECRVIDVDVHGRRCFGLLVPLSWSRYEKFAWPSEVRLADGRAERDDLRFEEKAKEIEEMKAKRRNAKWKGTS